MRSEEGANNMRVIKTCLFIGGEFDGERKEVPWNHSDKKHLVFPTFTALPQAADWASEALTTFGETVYRRERLRAEDTLYDVFVLDSMTLRDAMERLLDCYRPESGATTVRRSYRKQAQP